MITKKCRDCGKEFTLSDGEIEFFRSKGFELPNRCKNCRDKKKGKSQSSGGYVRKNAPRNTKKISLSPLFLIIAVLVIAGIIIKGSDFGLPIPPNLSDAFITEAYTSAEEIRITEEDFPETAYESVQQSDAPVTSAAVTSPKPSETTAKQTVMTEAAVQKSSLRFRSDKLLNDHYEKHGIEMGFSSAEEYERAAAIAAESPEALHKLEKEDGDDVYYIEATNEFVVISTDGYIRTYFYPNDGKDYFDRQ